MTTAILRPNGTNIAPDSVTGAASAHAATNDDSDASYFTDDDIGTRLDLSTVTMPAGAVAKQARIRHRSRADSVTGTLDVVAGPAGGAEVITAHHTLTTTIDTQSGAYLPVGWSQADIDVLRIVTNNLGSAWAFRILELYLDLVYVEQPVVALDAITPDPYTAGSVVPVSWVNTLDADGGDQTYYEVRIFTAAQYGIGGFDPETSPNEVAAVVATSSTSVNQTPLANGTYRRYQRVAQTVNGAQLWSDWDFDEFTITVDTADIDTVTATADDATAKIAVEVAWDNTTETPEYVEVERTIDGGITWEPVRGATFVAWDGSAAYEVDDYEVPNGAAADYRARAYWYSSGVVIVGAWTETASSATWTSTATWFKVPGSPTLNDTFNFKVYPNANRPHRRGVFHVLGAARPVVVADVRSSPIAQCSVQTSTEDEADSLLDILAESVVLIQAPTTMKRWGSRYCSPGDLSDEPLDPHTHGNSGWAIWRFDAVEVDAPADPDAGSA